MHSLIVWVQTVLIPTVGPLGLFVVAFFDSSFLSLPEINDLLVVTSAATHPSTAWMYVAGATLGSLAGCTILWYMGRRGGEPLLVRRFGQDWVDRSRDAFTRWGVLALAIPAILPPPMPFKIFVVSAGVFGFPYRRLAITLLVSRALRYAFWGVLGAIYGDEALAYLQRFDGWFERNVWLILGVTALLVAAVLLWWLVVRRRAAARA
jgi:membrane protein YqaA with SNARE-associated domain